MQRNLLRATICGIALLIAIVGCSDDDSSPTNTDPNQDPDPVACITEVTEDIDTNTIWGEACDTIHVMQSIEVRADLTILPGTIIRMADDAHISVDPSGSLSAIGEGNPRDLDSLDLPELIIFEGMNQTKGAWAGISFESTSQNNVLESVIIRDAGGVGYRGHAWVLTVAGESTSPGFLRLDDIVIEHCAGVGMAIPAGGGLHRHSFRLTFRDIDEQPIVVSFSTASEVPSTCHFEDLDMPHVLVTNGSITQVHDWNPLDVPYRVQRNCEINGGGLYITAGVTIEFEQDALLRSGDGWIDIAGTPDAPVLLTGAEKIPGYWGGLIYNSINTRNELWNATLEYAGAPVHGSFEFGVFVDGDAASRGWVHIRKAHFKDIAGDAIYIRGGGQAEIEMENTSFENITGAHVNDQNGGG